jgi:hypothetical protein
VVFAGNIEEDSVDAALVALSFVRAHAPWLKQRYGLYIDPRQNKPADYLFMIKFLDNIYEGPSLGAAVAGATHSILRVLSVFF